MIYSGFGLSHYSSAPRDPLRVDEATAALRSPPSVGAAVATSLTADIVREYLDYCPSSGVLHWKIAPARRIKVGAIAGYLDSKGYVVLMLKWRKHKAHRLAWLHYYGVEPNGHIDHIDGNHANNAINNLREVSFLQNRSNVPCRGYHRRGKRFMACIKTRGSVVFRQRFSTEDEARAAFFAAHAKTHNEFSFVNRPSEDGHE